MLTLNQLFSDYFYSHHAIPAFNIDSFEIYQAVESAVSSTHLPCIVQLSPNEDKFVTAEKLFLLVKKANLEGLPIYLNLDHGTDTVRLTQASHLGFDMVHFDASSQPLSTNTSATAALVSSLKNLNKNILVEAEFTPINDQSLTDPVLAQEFISHTRADLLAASLGNRHGNLASSPESIDLELLSRLHQALPHTYLTLHGGSGVPLDQIRQAIKLGVVKININTDLRQSFLTTLRQQLSSSSSEKIYDYFIPAISDLVLVIREKLIAFNT